MRAIPWLRLAIVLIGVCLTTGATARAQDLLVSNFGGSNLTRYDLTTRQLKGTHGASSGLVNPLAARVGPDGRLYVTSEGSNAILRFNPNTGAFIDTFISAGAGGLTQPTGLDWGADGSLYVASFDGNKVLKYNGATGGFISTFVSAGAGGLNGADNGMIFGPDGNLYVPSYFTSRVYKYNGTTGAFMSVFAVVSQPRVILFRDNDVLISSETQGIVRHNRTTGAFINRFATAGANGLLTPIGLAAAPDGSIYVGSSGNNRILKYNGATGAFVQTFTNAAGGVNLPAFLTVVVPSPAGSALLGVAAVLAARRRRT